MSVRPAQERTSRVTCWLVGLLGAVSFGCTPWYADRVEWAHKDSIPDEAQACDRDEDCVLWSTCGYGANKCVNRSSPEGALRHRRKDGCHRDTLDMVEWTLDDDEECLCAEGICINGGEHDD